MSEFNVTMFFIDHESNEEECLFNYTFNNKEAAKGALFALNTQAHMSCFSELEYYSECTYKDSDNCIAIFDPVTDEPIASWSWYLNEYPTIDEIPAEFV